MKYSEDLLDRLEKHKASHSTKHMGIMLLLMGKYKLDFDKAHMITKELYGD
tara:strand:+ start:298 stop:450 length:153 start_codon:yes stop_codon:yes gene_type:complete